MVCSSHVSTGWCTCTQSECQLIVVDIEQGKLANRDGSVGKMCVRRWRDQLGWSVGKGLTGGSGGDSAHAPGRRNFGGEGEPQPRHAEERGDVGSGKLQCRA